MSDHDHQTPVKFDELLLWLDSEEFDRPYRLIQLAPYPAQLMFVHAVDIPTLTEYLGQRDDDPISGGRAYQFAGPDWFGCVVAFGDELPVNQRASCMAHEAYHVVNYLYARYGAEHDLYNDEPTAYQLGHIVYWATKWFDEEIRDEEHEQDSDGADSDIECDGETDAHSGGLRVVVSDGETGRHGEGAGAERCLGDGLTNGIRYGLPRRLFDTSKIGSFSRECRHCGCPNSVFAILCTSCTRPV